MLPRRSALKPVLVFQGEVSKQDQEEIESFFYKIISIEDLWE